MKKIYLSLITLFVMFFGIMGVEAWEFKYTSYKAGDEIEVALGKGIKEKFYVIEDSSSDSETVLAIYKGVLGEEISFGLAENKTTFAGSNAETKLKELTKKWTTPFEIRLIDVNEIQMDAINDPKGEFHEPDYFDIGKSYWTKTVKEYEGVYQPYLVKGSSTGSKILLTTEDKGYIRPVIEAYKNTIVGGIESLPKNWNELAEGFKKSYVDVKDYISITDNMMNIKYSDDKEDYDIKINYDNGIIKFKTDKPDEYSDTFFNYYLPELVALKIYSEDEDFICVEENGYEICESSKIKYIMNDDSYPLSFEIDIAYYLDWETSKEDKENETLWNNFVAEFKKTDVFKWITDVETNTIDVTATKETLKITTSYDKGTVVTNFTYDNGIVKFVPSDNVETAIVDALWVTNAIVTLSDIKGYDLEKLNEWIKEDRKYTLKDDGIEFTIEKYKNGSISGERYTAFKLDIKNGLKTFVNETEETKEETTTSKKEEIKDEQKVENTKKEEAEKNPKTADTNVILVMLGLIASSSLIVVSKKKLCKK